MNRSMSLLAIVATAGIITLKTMDVSALLPDPRDILPFFVQQNVHEYYAFKAQFEDTLRMLADDEISLRDAHRRVKSTATHCFPNYLSNLQMSDRGANTDERIARNLVGHIQSLAEFGHASPTRVAALESELAEFLGHECACSER